MERLRAELCDTEKVYTSAYPLDFFDIPDK